jgi:hypothetical protein
LGPFFEDRPETLALSTRFPFTRIGKDEDHQHDGKKERRFLGKEIVA